MATSIKMQKPIPDQARVIRYCMEFLVSQAHRSLTWRCQSAQIARSRISDFNPNDATNDYVTRLQALRLRSEDEAFQACTRTLNMIREAMDAQSPDSLSEIFLPGMGSVQHFRFAQSTNTIYARLLHF